VASRGARTSRANAKQRRGRAGRVRSGVAVHLFTSHRHAHIMLSAQSPEVQRVPLEQLALRIKVDPGPLSHCQSLRYMLCQAI